MSELREKVKLAILRAVVGRDLRIVEKAHDQSEEAADAVLSLVLEECARVAEESFSTEPPTYVPLFIAEAIRGLNNKVQG